jgi:hypothetical protein
VTSVSSAVPKAVPDSVVSSADNTVKVNKTALRGSYKPMTGSSVNPVVPRTDTGQESPAQPYFTGGQGRPPTTHYAGSEGAPSVPTDGFLFRSPPIDNHYTVPAETRDPYGTVGRPGTVGWRSRIQMFQNHTGLGSQNTSNTGFRNLGIQQRTSVMSNALPPIGAFGTESYIPRQQPQAVNYNRIRPSVGTDAYGTGVLNRDTFGAGQTAGGIGGNNYTPAPGPPATNSITNPPAVAAEPTWG